MGLRWRVGAGFIALNSFESGVRGCSLGGAGAGGGVPGSAVPLRRS